MNSSTKCIRWKITTLYTLCAHMNMILVYRHVKCHHKSKALALPNFVLGIYASWRGFVVQHIMHRLPADHGVASSFSTWKISRSIILCIYHQYTISTVTCLFWCDVCYCIRYPVQVQRKKHVLHAVDHADHTLTTWQHERDHTDQECIYLSLKI